MTRIRRYARTSATLLVAIAALAGTRASAETSGRITIMNDVDMLTNPSAMIDAMLVRVFLTSDHIGGKNAKFVVDMRSDVPLIAKTSMVYGTSNLATPKLVNTPFNGYCHGDFFADRQKCRNIPIRDQSLGQLSHLAGVYDLYVQLGESGEGKTTVSIGRKTLYEAGLVTVDGLTIEKTLSKETRIGVFGGLAPDPLTRMVNPLYQTAGGYLAYTKTRTMMRVGADGLNYSGADANKFGAQQGPVAQATVFNQNFFLLSKGVSIATWADFDVIPGQDRLEYVDLTFRPTSRYRFRLNATRFRPIQFDRSPQLLNGGVLEPLLAGYRGAAGGPFLSPRDPEVASFADRSKPINLAKLSAHYVTTNSITPYVSAEYRVRELDKKTETLADVGAYTYDPYDSGVTARARIEYQKGFDATGIRFGGSVEREMSENVVIGGGIDYGTLTYQLRNPTTETNYSKGDQTLSLNALARYDRPQGLSFFFEAYYLIDNRTPSSSEPGRTGAPTFTPAPISSTQLSALAGITVRFGAGR